MMLASMPEPQSGDRYGGTFETSPFRSFGEISMVLLQSHSPAITPIPDTGAALAVKYLTLGVAADLPRKPGRGGARNRSTRESHALKAAQIANLMAAERHAVAIGLPFTRMITIHWKAAGVPLAGMAKATGAFLDLVSKWTARNTSRTAWLYAHENGDGKGSHVHLPPGLVKALTGHLRGWLRRITGKPYCADVIYSKPIGGRLGLEVGNPGLHAINLEAALAYILKGASPEAASQFGLVRLEPGGRVIGKRCGTSQNIGAKARAKAGVSA